MGSGRDKRKKAKPKAPGQGEEKTARKTERNEQRRDTRASKKVAVRTCSRRPHSQAASLDLTQHACACSAGR